eukprot:1204642-Amphidinium_carterae.2
MLHFRIEVLVSAPGAVYSVAKAVPGFLQVSVIWRWLISNTSVSQAVFSDQGHSKSVISSSLLLVCRIVAGFTTGFGLDFLAGRLSGPSNDCATLQLVGTLFVSTLVP